MIREIQLSQPLGVEDLPASKYVRVSLVVVVQGRGLAVLGFGVLAEQP
jgi:hypothetical protein